MNTPLSDKKTGNGPVLTAGIWKRAVQLIAVLAIQGAVLFLSSGRLNWTAAWAFLGVYLLALAVNALLLLRKDPELIAERAEVKEGAKPWDRILVLFITLIFPLITLVVSGLDRRFGWSPQLNLAVELTWLICILLGYGLVTWAMLSNTFFSGVVRIQKERGHTVASHGPYRFVRHPGYVGMLLFYLATPLFLGSLWGLVPAGISAVLMVVRTALEDRTLQAELDGYSDYTRQVRYRLLPGIW
jgi:protein-S-isoprenylcysteine O-methyltransferase Ste14